MLAQAGIEALIASIPAALVMAVKETVGDSLQKTVRSAIAKGEEAATEAVNAAAGRWKISGPIAVGAVLVVGAVAHGLWRGKRKHEERSFAEAEEERRAQRDEAPRARA